MDIPTMANKSSTVKRGKKQRHLFDMSRGTHTISQHRNKKAKTRGTKGAFGGKKK